MSTFRWPGWWEWDLELSPHLLKRMEDRRFTEIDLRAMLGRATVLEREALPGRWLVTTRHRGRGWSVIVEPDPILEVIVVVTAYPAERKKK